MFGLNYNIAVRQLKTVGDASFIGKCSWWDSSGRACVIMNCPSTQAARFVQVFPVMDVLKE